MDTQEHLVAYLLGELPEDEQLRLEQDYLANDAAYEQLLVLEDELAYDYLEGRLSPQRRQRFETTIGATERGARNLEFARLLLDGLRASRAPVAWHGRHWAGAIAAAVALLILPAWLAIHITRLSSQLASLRADTRASQAQFERELAAAKSPVLSAAVEARFLLTPGLSRSGEGSTLLQISAGADTVRFELILPPGATAGEYAITISIAGGGQVWSGSATPSGGKLAVQSPAKLLASGEYQIAVRRLSAGEQLPDLATYSIRLVRK